MKKSSFRDSLHQALKRQGFFAVSDGVAFESSEVRGICAAGVSKKNGLVSVSLGYWLFPLGRPAADAYWKCHIYGSLGTMLDGFEEVTFAVGSGDEIAMEAFVRDRSTDVADCIRRCLSIDSLIAALRAGRFQRSLVRKEALSFLESSAPIARQK
jgi:hypothetical protein